MAKPKLEDEPKFPEAPTVDQLDTFERYLQTVATKPETPNVSAQLALQLVDEIRRLRAEAAPPPTPAPVGRTVIQCRHCGGHNVIEG